PMDAPSRPDVRGTADLVESSRRDIVRRTARDRRSMKGRLLTPGPTPVPEETLLELARPVFYHRGPQFRQILADVTVDLQYIFRTQNPVFTLTSSGTGGMEAALASSLPPGSKAICLIAGRWGERWRNIAVALGIEVVAVTVSPGEAVGPDSLAEALQQHP